MYVCMCVCVCVYHITWPHAPVVRKLHNQRCEDLEASKIIGDDLIHSSYFYETNI
jgi:hypothetical protein